MSNEYWIKFKIGDQFSTHQVVDVSMNPLNDSIHVIEYSAYEKIKSELKLNADLLADNKLMREALEFYARRDSYLIYDADYNLLLTDDQDYNVETEQYVPGRRANRILSQLKGKYDE